MARYLALAVAELAVVALATLALVLILRTGHAPAHAHVLPAMAHAVRVVKP